MKNILNIKNVNFYLIALIFLTFLTVSFINVKPKVAKAAMICTPELLSRLNVDIEGYGNFNNLDTDGTTPKSMDETRDVNIISGDVLTFTIRMEMPIDSNIISFPGSDDYEYLGWPPFPKYPNPTWFPYEYPGPGTDNPYPPAFPPIYDSAGYRRPDWPTNPRILQYNGGIVSKKYDSDPIVSDDVIFIQTVPYCVGGFPETTTFRIQLHIVPACKIDTFSCDASDNLSWATSNCTSQNIIPDIGAVSASGSTSGTGGVTYLLSASKGSSNASSLATCSLPPSYEVTPDAINITVGQTKQFTGTYDPDGSSGSGIPQDVTASANWSVTSGASFASVSNAGLASCIDDGTATISSTYSGINSTATLTCDPILASKIVVTSIVCDNESDLPNWEGTGGLINSTTATNFLATHPNCHTEVGWSFQRSYYTTVMGCNLYNKTDIAPGNTIGEITAPSGFCPWVTFGTTDASGIATLDISDFPINNPTGSRPETDRIYVREVLKSGYFPFSSPPGTGDDPYSAEIWCHNDKEEYNNADVVLLTGNTGTYYCVAFNVLSMAAVSTYDISPTTFTITVGQTKQFTGTYDPDGSSGSGIPQDVTSSATWSVTSGGAFASVSNAGLASCTGVGTATISSTYSGVSNTATLTCDPAASTSEFEVKAVISGQGTVTPDVAGGACAIPSLTCWKYTEDERIVLTATNIPGRIFVGWGGDCGLSNSSSDSSGGTCNLKMDGNKNVSAKFAIDPNYKEF